MADRDFDLDLRQYVTGLKREQPFMYRAPLVGTCGGVAGDVCCFCYDRDDMSQKLKQVRVFRS